MSKILINLPEIHILYVRDLNSLIENKNVDFYIQEGLDGTYEVYQLTQNYFGYHSDFHNRLAYDFDLLTEENKNRYGEFCRHMVQNSNGSYYEKRKRYVKDKKNEV